MKKIIAIAVIILIFGQLFLGIRIISFRSYPEKVNTGDLFYWQISVKSPYLVIPTSAVNPGRGVLICNRQRKIKSFSLTGITWEFSGSARYVELEPDKNIFLKFYSYFHLLNAEKHLPTPAVTNTPVQETKMIENKSNFTFPFFIFITIIIIYLSSKYKKEFNYEEQLKVLLGNNENLTIEELVDKSELPETLKAEIKKIRIAEFSNREVTLKDKRDLLGKVKQAVKK